MKQTVFIVQAQGPDGELYGLNAAETRAEARAWVVWFGRFLKVEGWNNFQVQPMSASLVEEMMAQQEVAQ